MAIFTIFFACTTENTSVFTINGSVEGLTDGKAYLQTRKGGSWVKLDSSTLSEGTFQFTGNIDFPEVYYINFEDQKGFLPVFVENAEIKVTGDVETWNEAEITGSVSQDELNAYKEARKNLDSRFDEMYEMYRRAKEEDDQPRLEKVTAELEILDAEEKDFLTKYIKEHNASIMAPYLTRKNSYMFELEELEELTGSFDESLEGSNYTQQLKDQIKILKTVAIGQLAPDFTMNDTLGNPFTLSSLKGKYLLVDFWASWCSPCRAENPNVVLNYLAYKDKGFDVLGVSLDNKKDKWIEAIYEDNLLWTHVSDLEGWGNAAAKLYAVNSIPSNVLVDPDGIIIARNLRGDDLGARLDELFSE